MNFLLPIYAHDIDVIDCVNLAHHNFETMLMRQVIESNESISEHILSHAKFQHVCEWYIRTESEEVGIFQVSCRNGSLQGIDIIRIGREYAIEYLPNSVEAISMMYVDQCKPLDTRQLPSNLRKIDMIKCKVRGTISLDCLPRAIFSIDLQQNEIKGPIQLLSLPVTLIMLNLQSNAIAQDVVYYKGLSPRIHAYLDGNAIQSVESLDEEKYIRHRTRWTLRAMRLGEIQI